jgi:HAD superfamily hydrolase (TIGR01549 family)
MKYMLRRHLKDYKALVLDMDGTLYYQLPVRICMAFELFLYYLIHLNKIKDLLALYRFRKSREHGCLQETDAIIDYWVQTRPLKYIRLFRDKKLIEFVREFRDVGTLIVVYSDYPATEKINALSSLDIDFIFCATDVDIQCLKPDTKGLKHIIKIIGKPVKDVVFIGDRYEKDGKCAEGLDMDYIILDGNPLSRYIRIDKLWRML